MSTASEGEPAPAIPVSATALTVSSPPADSGLRSAPKALPPEPFQPLQVESSKGQRAVARGILLSALLGGVKVVSGVFGNSYALIADGIESILDVFTSLVVIGSLRLAIIAPTEKHPYGYGKIEPLGTMAVGVALLIAAAVMTWQSILEIIHPHHAPAAFTLAVLVAVVLIKEGMFQYLRRVGREAGSGVIESDAWHHRSDALTSLAAFIGISVALIGGEGYEEADDWATLAACTIIAFNGIRLLHRGIVDILDVAPDPEAVAAVRAAALGVGQIRRVEKVLLRKTGLGWLGEIHIEIDGDLSVTEGHRIAHQVKDAILAGSLRVIDVAVHVEPCKRGSERKGTDEHPAAG